MKQKMVIILFLATLVLLPSCYRYIDWGIDVVNQGDIIETCSCQVQKYIRNARVYDQFTTLGLFDAMWIHDEVLQAYACAHAAKFCMTPEQETEFLERQREEFGPYISFYLLTEIPGKVGLMLTDENPIWTLQLRIGGHCFTPVKLKTVELTPEFRYFFEKRLTVFKKQYLLQFNALDSYNLNLIGPNVGSFELVWSRVGRQVNMEWCLDSYGEIAADYWPLDDVGLAYDINTNIQ